MKTLKALFGVFVVVAVIYVSWAVVPHYFNNYRFEDAIEVEARLNAYSGKSEREMQETLYQKARELNLPLKKEQINVRREGNQLRIWAEYTVQVQLPGYAMTLRFQPSSTGRRI